MNGSSDDVLAGMTREQAEELLDNAERWMGAQLAGRYPTAGILALARLGARTLGASVVRGSISCVCGKGLITGPVIVLPPEGRGAEGEPSAAQGEEG